MPPDAKPTIQEPDHMSIADGLYCIKHIVLLEKSLSMLDKKQTKKNEIWKRHFAIEIMLQLGKCPVYSYECQQPHFPRFPTCVILTR